MPNAFAGTLSNQPAFLTVAIVANGSELKRFKMPSAEAREPGPLSGAQLPALSFARIAEYAQAQGLTADVPPGAAFALV